MTTVIRSRRNKITRIAKLRKRRRKILGISLSSILISLLVGGFFINKLYVAKKCRDITYAIDYYLTNLKDKDLRLKSVRSMSLVDKTDSTVIIEAFGLSVIPPHESTTLTGSFSKLENGSWILNEVNRN